MYKAYSILGFNTPQTVFNGRLGPPHSISPDHIMYHQLLEQCGLLREKPEQQLSENALAFAGSFHYAEFITIFEAADAV